MLQPAPVLAGEISGIVSLTSTTSTVTPALILRDRHVCGVKTPVKLGWLDLDGRKLKGVLVYLEAQPSRRLPKKQVSIDQENCTFLPRVAATTIGSAIRFSNSDPVLHNVHVFDPNGRTVANWAMPAKGQTTEAIVLVKAGRYRVGCDAGHIWMNAHVFVFDHPYFALSQKGGRFTLGRIPAGRHRLIAWHPDLGTREATVDVKAKGRVKVAVEY